MIISYAQSNISFTQYVDIKSNFISSAPNLIRAFCGRHFTTNPLLPTQTLGEFVDAYDVGSYFGFTSEEYLRALQYFSFQTKSFNSPTLISFARWTDVDTAPLIFGVKAAYALSTFTPITTGAISLSIGGVTNILTNLDFSAAVSLAGVAAVIQAAVNAQSGLQWTAAQVLFDPVNKQFDFIGGATGVAAITAQLAGTGIEILNLIGWGTGAIFSNGDDTTSITETLQNSTLASNNFGSFVFMPTLTIDQHVEAATWTQGQDTGFIYHVPIPLASYTDYQTALVALNSDYVDGSIISPQSNQWIEEIPMANQAATNFNVSDGTQGYNFLSQVGMAPSVTMDAVKNALDLARINYYGRTQNAGDQKAWYQLGVILNSDSAPLGINVVADEIWLKSANASSIINLFLTANSIPADNQGIAQVLSTIQPNIQQALANGMISVSRVLTSTQISIINNLTGDSQAWQQVQSIGYWINATVVSLNTGFAIQYQLIYLRNNQVIKVLGDHFNL